MPPVRGILFDLWNTLIAGSGANPVLDLARRLTSAGAADWRAALERGMMLRPFPDIEAALPGIARAAGISWSPREQAEAAAAWRALAGHSSLFPDTAPVLDRLRKCYRTGLLSNTQSFDLDILGSSGLEKKFHTVHLSWRTGLLKPAPEAFAAACRDLALPASAVLMVGDSRRDDVEGARACGLQAVLIRRPGAHLSHVEPNTDDPNTPTVTSLEELEAWLGSHPEGNA